MRSSAEEKGTCLHDFVCLCLCLVSGVWCLGLGLGLGLGLCLCLCLSLSPPSLSTYLACILNPRIPINGEYRHFVILHWHY